MYLSSEISYQDLALQEGITNPSLIVNWVHRFRTAGSDALRQHKKGRKKTLNKLDNTTQSTPLERTSVDTSAEHVRELEDELLKLRIENAFLKEWRGHLIPMPHKKYLPQLLTKSYNKKTSVISLRFLTARRGIEPLFPP